MIAVSCCSCKMFPDIEVSFSPMSLVQKLYRQRGLQTVAGTDHDRSLVKDRSATRGTLWKWVFLGIFTDTTLRCGPSHQRWMLSEEAIQEGSLKACGCESCPREKGELFISAAGKELALGIYFQQIDYSLNTWFLLAWKYAWIKTTSVELFKVGVFFWFFFSCPQR